MDGGRDEPRREQREEGWGSTEGGGGVKVDEVDTCLNNAFSRSHLTWGVVLDRTGSRHFHHRRVSP